VTGVQTCALPIFARAYAGIDVLLTGLPEREALGLNVIEAQACGVPVLAPGAGPFTETVLDRRTGWLYADPRDTTPGFPAFPDVMSRICQDYAQGRLLDPRQEIEHMHKFSADEFRNRLEKLLASVR
jgi:glycosyltransferase involved in cell wall biosynthesis